MSIVRESKDKPFTSYKDPRETKTAVMPDDDYSPAYG